MHFSISRNWKFSIKERAQAMRVGPYSRDKARVKVEFKGERAGRKGSKGDRAFYRRQKRQSVKRESDARKQVSGPH